MSQFTNGFTPDQIAQLTQLLNDRINPLRRTPVGYISRVTPNDTPYYGFGAGGQPITNASDPSLPPISGGSTSAPPNTAQSQATDAAHQDDTRYGQILDLYGQARGLTQNQLNETGQVLGAVAPGLNRSYDAAAGEIAGAGRSARRDILTQRDRSVGQLAGSLAGRGLTNTTIADNGRRAIVGDTQRNLATLNENLGAQRAGLAVQRGTAVAGANTNLANFMRDRNATETGLLTQTAGTISHRSDLYSALQAARLASAGGSGGGGGGLAAGLGIFSSLAGLAGTLGAASIAA